MNIICRYINDLQLQCNMFVFCQIKFIIKFIYAATADLTCNCVLIIRNNFYIINNDFYNDFKIVSFTQLGVGTVSTGQTITFQQANLKTCYNKWMDMQKTNYIIGSPVCADFNVMRARANMVTNMAHVIIFKTILLA